jgi:hypothetical protein
VLRICLHVADQCVAAPYRLFNTAHMALIHLDLSRRDLIRTRYPQPFCGSVPIVCRARRSGKVMGSESG